MIGEYITKHFVAAYQQAGDFEAVNVNGRIRKNGGNVASYFCTADAQVIHAVEMVLPFGIYRVEDH